MSIKIADLVSKVGWEVDEAPLEKLSRSIDGLKNNIASIGESVERVKHLMEIAFGVELIKKLYDVSEQFAEWGRDLKVTSEILGVTTDEIQALGYAAGQSGVSTDEMTHSLAHLSKHIYEAKQGSKEAAEAFYKAGISFNEVQGFTSAQQALDVLSDRMQAVHDPIQRLGMAQALMGRGGYQMVSFLSKGSAAMHAQGEEARRLGLLISAPQVNNLERMALGFQRLHMFVREIGAYIASYFGPAIIVIIDKVIAFYNANRKLIDLELRSWLDRIAYGMGYVAGVAIRVSQWILYFIKTVHDLWAALDETPSWGRGLPPWATAIKEFFESFGVGGKSGIRISDIFKGENSEKLAAILDAIIDKTKAKVQSIFRNIFGTAQNESIMEGLGKTVGDLLNTALIASGFALSLGGAIADGMIEAFIAKFRTEFPAAATLLFGESTHEGKEGPATSANVGLSAFSADGKYSFRNIVQGIAGGTAPAVAGPPSHYSNASIVNNHNYDVGGVHVKGPADGKIIGDDLRKTLDDHHDAKDRANRQRAMQDQQAQASEATP